VEDRQYILLIPESKREEQRFDDCANETDNAEALRLYPESHGYKVPGQPAGKGPTYDLGFHMADPEDTAFEVMQYTPGSLSVQSVGKYVSDERVSRRLLHAGIPVSKPATGKLYVDTL